MMEPLVTFTDKEVLEGMPPCNWVKIMPSRLVEEPTQREHSHSRTCWAHSRESFLVAHGGRWPGPQATPITQTTTPATPIQEVMPQQAESSGQPQTPPLGFAEIVQSLWGDNPPRIITSIPLGGKDHDPIQIIGSSMLSAHLLRDVASGAMCINLITCSLSVVDMGLNCMADDCPTPAPEEVMDSD